MGQTSAKLFPQPTPYGQTPQSNVVQQAQPVAQAPQQQLPVAGAYGTGNYPLPTAPTASTATSSAPMPQLGSGMSIPNSRKFYGY